MVQGASATWLPRSSLRVPRHPESCAFEALRPGAKKAQDRGSETFKNTISTFRHGLESQASQTTSIPWTPLPPQSFLSPRSLIQKTLQSGPPERMAAP